MGREATETEDQRSQMKSWLRAAFDSAAVSDRRKIWEWAEEHFVCPPCLTIGSGGKYQPHISRHLNPILEALHNPRVRKVTLMKPVRGAGSLIADIWTVWIVANEPGLMMATFQTKDAARDYAEDRANPEFTLCAQTRALFPENRHLKRTLAIKFRHGMPFYMQGPALSNLQAKGTRYLRNEEMWMWERGVYEQLLARIKDWEEIGMSKIFNVSQGGEVGDALDQEFTLGNQQEWHAPCFGCGQEFPAGIYGKRDDGSIWGLKWDDNETTRTKDRRWIESECLKTLRWECPDCKFEHCDEFVTRAAWNERGRFIAMNPAAMEQNVSFHYSAIILRSWRILAQELIGALNELKGGSIEAFKAWKQKHAAESWSPEMLAAPMSRQRHVISTPSEELGRFIAVDHQNEGLRWVLAVALLKDGRAQRLWFGKLFSEEEIADKAKELGVKPNFVFNDCAFDTKNVYRMCHRRGWIPLLGSDRPYFIHATVRDGKRLSIQRSYSAPIPVDPEIGTRMQGRSAIVRMIRWSNPAIKDEFQAMLSKKSILEPELSDSLTEEREYEKQLKGEWKVHHYDKRTGQTSEEWKSNKNNHARDCWCMIVVGIKLLKSLLGMEVVVGAKDDQGEKVVVTS